MSEDEESNSRTYVGVMIILAILTLIEVYTPEMEVARDLVIALLLAIATAKASLVVAYYMHLRYEPSSIQLIPIAPLVLVGILLLALFFGVTPV